MSIDIALLTRDIDRFYHPGLVHNLAASTGNPESEIKGLMLSSFEGRISEKVFARGYSKWILPLGIFHRRHKRKGVVFCPQCLAEDSVKYFRKEWRLSFVVMCWRHKCMLVDSCTKCGSSIDYQRTGVGLKKGTELPSDNLGVCAECGHKLWLPEERTAKDASSWLEPSYLQFLRAFDLGGTAVPGLDLPLDIQVFEGLWPLISSLTRKRGAEVRSRIEEELGIELIRGESFRNLSFDQLPISERKKLLLVTFWLLDRWPSRLIGLAEGTKYGKSVFADYLDQIPFWLFSEVHEHLDHKQYVVTDEEILSVIDYLHSQDIKPDAPAISEILNIHVSSCRERLSRLRSH